MTLLWVSLLTAATVIVAAFVDLEKQLKKYERDQRKS